MALLFIEEPYRDMKLYSPEFFDWYDRYLRIIGSSFEKNLLL